jgi:hypothetical protein
LTRLYQICKFSWLKYLFVSFELSNVFTPLVFFSSEERQENGAEVTPRSPLASPVTRAAIPLPDEVESSKQVTEKTACKVIQKRKCNRQGMAQPVATIERHTPGSLADDVNFLIPFAIYVWFPFYLH